MNPKLPRPDEPAVDGRGAITRPWRNYLASLAAGGDLAGVWEAIREIRAQLGQGGGLPADTNVQGALSVQSDGLLSNGLVRITLINDEVAPAPRSYYGTGADGARGYHALPASFLPMTTGEIVGGQPVLVYGPDGRLIYGPVT